MIGRRDALVGGVPKIFVMYKRCKITVRNIFFGGVIKLQCPIKRFGIFFECDKPQVVHNVAAANNKHTFFAQGAELGRQGVVGFGAFGVVETHLKHRYIRIWKHMADHHPAAVVEPPVQIPAHVKAFHCLHGGAGVVGGAGAGVTQGVELGRKAVVVVDGFWRPCAVHVGAVHKPVRRDAQNGIWPRQILPHRFPGAGEGVVFQGVGGGAVADEEHGHAWGVWEVAH